jgi:hypothetical protein
MHHQVKFFHEFPMATNQTPAFFLKEQQNFQELLFTLRFPHDTPDRERNLGPDKQYFKNQEFSGQEEAQESGVKIREISNLARLFPGEDQTVSRFESGRIVGVLEQKSFHLRRLRIERHVKIPALAAHMS